MGKFTRFIRWCLAPSPFKLAFPLIVLVSIFELLQPFELSSAWFSWLKRLHVFVASFENRALDFKFQHRGADSNASQVVLVGVDEKSISALGRWPWSRNHIASTIENLEQAGARVIAFDMVFDSPDPSACNIATDRMFSETIQKYKNIVLGYFWYFDKSQIPTGTVNFDDRLFQISSSMISPKYIFSSEENKKDKIEGDWLHGVGMVTNLEKLSSMSQNHGYFSTEMDDDGVYRSMPLIVEYDRAYFPALSLKALSLYTGKDIQMTMFVDNTGYVQNMNLALGDLEPIPVDHRGFYQVNWKGPQRSVPYISMSDVAQGKPLVEEEQYDAESGTLKKKSITLVEGVKGKVVVIGAVATGIGDVRHTPMDGFYPGPEMHANVIDNVIRGNYLRRVSGNFNHHLIYCFALFITGILFIFALDRMRALSGSVLLLVVISSYIAFDYFYLFVQRQMISHVMVPVLMYFMASYLIVTIYKYMTEERERSKVKGAFEKYVSPAIVHEMLKDPTKLRLKGEKVPLTVMFTDVRGFTTISEKLDAIQVSDLLNGYLSPMTELVFEHSGTLDKYMGDAIMAFWGAPIHFQDHAVKACRCALKMMEKLQEIKKDLKQKNLPMIDIGIGINSGEMSVGNMGSQKIFSYTVLGDNVNLGSRLEGINKTYGTHIIISEYTFGLVKDQMSAREIDRVRVKGKELPVRIFELLAEKERGLSAEQRAVVQSFSLGMELYLKQQWNEAIAAFEKGLQSSPDDGPTQTFMERCRYFKNHSPGADWDGTWVMTSK